MPNTFTRWTRAPKLSLLKRASSEKPLPGGQPERDPRKKDKRRPHRPWKTGGSFAMSLDTWAGCWAACWMWMCPSRSRNTPKASASWLHLFWTMSATATSKFAQYLVLFTENKDGMPFDYNQVRVFTWNVRKHRYETAYRERNLNGVLPVTVSHETFDKEGDLPVFVVRVKDDAGNVTERKYKLNTPIVRRVLAPGEQKDVSRQSSVIEECKKERINDNACSRKTENRQLKTGN